MYLGFYTQQEIVAINNDELSLITGNNPFIDKSDLKDLNKIVFEHSSEDFEIKITRDGLIGLRVSAIERDYPKYESVKDACNVKSTEKWRLYVEHVNALQIAIMTSALNVVFQCDISGVHDVTRDDVLPLTSDMRFQGLVSENNSAFMRMFRGRSHQMLTSTKFFLNEHFDAFIKEFSDIISNEIVTFVANVERALVHYRSGNNNLALALAWFDIEVLLKKKLKKYLKEPQNNYVVDNEKGTKRFNSKRCKYLVDEMEISKVIELLEVLELIDFGIYCAASECRKERNGMVHGSIPVVSAEAAKRCIELLLGLINLESNSALKINTSTSMTMI